MSFDWLDDDDDDDPWDYWQGDVSPVATSWFMCGGTSCWCAGEKRMISCHCGCHQREFSGGPGKRMRWDGSEYRKYGQ